MISFLILIIRNIIIHDVYHLLHLIIYIHLLIICICYKELILSYNVTNSKLLMKYK